MLTQEIQIKLTAFALGETDFLTPEELEEIKTLLMVDSEARAYVQEMKETAEGLTAEFAHEVSPGLTGEQKKTIDRAAQKGNRFKLSRYLLPLSAVAACAIATFVLVDWGYRQEQEWSSIRSAPEAMSRLGELRDGMVEDRESMTKAQRTAAGATADADSLSLPGTPSPKSELGHVSKDSGDLSSTSSTAAAGNQPPPAALPRPGAVKMKEQTGMTSKSEADGILPDYGPAQRRSEVPKKPGAPVGGSGSVVGAGEREQDKLAVATGNQKMAAKVSGASRSGRIGAEAHGENLDKAARDLSGGKNEVAGPVALKQPEPTRNDESAYRWSDKLTRDSKSMNRVHESDQIATVTSARENALLVSQEAYDVIAENPFLKAQGNPLSTFSIDVDTASYANVRRMIERGQRPPGGAVRVEEFINYFPYEYSQPADEKPFAVHVETHPAPWATDHLLVKVGLKGKEIAPEKLPPANLVFLIDVSGSMNELTKLPLAVSSLKLLITQLRDEDRVAMVVYAGNSGLVLPSTSGKDKATIMAALDKLSAGGSTNGGEGIQLAYKTATENFIKGGSNRVILMTDGDFNVGVTSRSDLNDLIEKSAKTGVYLSIFGFGMGNLKDSTLEELSRKGNGNYGYIDGLKEAQKALVEQMGGTLFTIAKDVKIQVEFNPALVKSYRLIGYENRVMAKEDFNNDLKDAGDIGSGHTVTALYEVVPAWLPDAKPLNGEERKAALEREIGLVKEQLDDMRKLLQTARMTEEGLKAHTAKFQALENRLVQLQAQQEKLAAAMKDEENKPREAAKPDVDPLKYQAAPEPKLEPRGGSNEMLTIKLRYKAPDAADVQGTSKLIEVPVKMVDTRLRIARPKPSTDFKFAAAVAEYAMILKGSQYAGKANFLDVLNLAEAGLGEDKGGHRADFIKLVRQTMPLMPGGKKE